MRRDDSIDPVAPLTSAQRAALQPAALHARRWLRAQEAEPEEVMGAGSGESPSVLLAGAGRDLARRAALQLARELGRDLYPVDLRSLVSRYLAETERNLGRVLETAERTGAVLLFDESDALFGKRSDADAHRYQHIDIDYLERRLSAFQGFAILACRTSLPELGSAAERFACVVELH